jgi:hypothetical protein
VFNATPRPLYPWEGRRYPLYKRLGGAQRRSGRVGKISPSPAFDPRTVYPVASRYNDCAIRAHCGYEISTKLNEINGTIVNVDLCGTTLQFRPDNVNLALLRLPVWHFDIQPFIPKIF